MKRKHVYLTDDPAEARAAIAAARHAGALDEDIALVAREGIEMEGIHGDRRKCGTWFSHWLGSASPDPVRRRFDEEIESGGILVVVDVADESIALVDASVQATGAVLLPFEEASALS